MKWANPLSITPSLEAGCQGYFSAGKNMSGARTVQLTHQVASRVLRQAVEDGLIPANPASRVKTPSTQRRAIRVLSVDEVEALADAFDNRYRVMVLLGAYAGLRFGEMSALRTPHLRLLERRSRSRRAPRRYAGRCTSVR